jgi:membrane-bound serine protease (ClpP class)
MTAIAILLVLGALCFGGEIFFPGMVLGALGVVAMIAGAAVAFDRFGPIAGGLTAVGALVLAAFTFWLEFVVFPQTRLSRALSVTGASGTNRPPVPDPAAVTGRECVALTAMAPSGYVDLDGRQYEATCRSGKVAPGERLKIVEVDSFQLVVTQNHKTA